MKYIKKKLKTLEQILNENNITNNGSTIYHYRWFGVCIVSSMMDYFGMEIEVYSDPDEERDVYYGRHIGYTWVSSWFVDYYSEHELNKELWKI